MAIPVVHEFSILTGLRQPLPECPVFPQTSQVMRWSIACTISFWLGSSRTSSRFKSRSILIASMSASLIECLPHWCVGDAHHSDLGWRPTSQSGSLLLRWWVKRRLLQRSINVLTVWTYQSIVEVRDKDPFIHSVMGIGQDVLLKPFLCFIDCLSGCLLETWNLSLQVIGFTQWKEFREERSRALLPSADGFLVGVEPLHGLA